MKRILYIHGLGGSGNGRTTKLLKMYAKNDLGFSYDLPMDPDEVISFLSKKIKEEKIDTIIGTSLGGFYSLIFSSLVSKVIAVNPVIQPSVIIPKLFQLNEKIPYYNKRDDDFYIVTEEIIKKYQVIEENIISKLKNEKNVFGLFGIKDDVVNHQQLFQSISNHIYFANFSHRLEKDVIANELMDLIYFKDNKCEIN